VERPLVGFDLFTAPDWSSGDRLEARCLRTLSVRRAAFDRIQCSQISLADDFIE
jgi:hypothetical protein